jgi:hypothetical protein
VRASLSFVSSQKFARAVMQSLRKRSESFKCGRNTFTFGGEQAQNRGGRVCVGAVLVAVRPVKMLGVLKGRKNGKFVGIQRIDKDVDT